MFDYKFSKYLFYLLFGIVVLISVMSVITGFFDMFKVYKKYRIKIDNVLPENRKRKSIITNIKKERHKELKDSFNIIIFSPIVCILIGGLFSFIIPLFIEKLVENFGKICFEIMKIVVPILLLLIFYFFYEKIKNSRYKDTIVFVFLLIFIGLIACCILGPKSSFTLIYDEDSDLLGDKYDNYSRF